MPTAVPLLRWGVCGCCSWQCPCCRAAPLAPARWAQRAAVAVPSCSRMACVCVRNACLATCVVPFVLAAYFVGLVGSPLPIEDGQQCCRVPVWVCARLADSRCAAACLVAWSAPCGLRVGVPAGQGHVGRGRHRVDDGLWVPFPPLLVMQACNRAPGLQLSRCPPLGRRHGLSRAVRPGVGASPGPVG